MDEGSGLGVGSRNGNDGGGVLIERVQAAKNTMDNENQKREKTFFLSTNSIESNVAISRPIPMIGELHKPVLVFRAPAATRRQFGASGIYSQWQPW